jgi:serine acetyltransferase
MAEQDRIIKSLNSSRLSVIIHRILSMEGPLIRPFQKIIKIVFHLEISTRHFRNGLLIIHPYNVIIHPDAQLGSNVTIYHNVTVATIWSGKKKGTPKIEDGVVVYPHSILLGNITIGKNSIVGAGSVVIKDVPPGSIVAGNPARIIGKVLDERPIEIRRFF